jgi:carbamoylphosphate synthase small subunit
MTRNLSDYLESKGIVGIAGIDTRKLTRLLREKGAQNGCIMAGDIDEALHWSMHGHVQAWLALDLAKVVTCESAYLGSKVNGAWARDLRSQVATIQCCCLRFWGQAQYSAHAHQSRVQGHRGSRATRLQK